MNSPISKPRSLSVPCLTLPEPATLIRARTDAARICYDLQRAEVEHCIELGECQIAPCDQHVRYMTCAVCNTLQRSPDAQVGTEPRILLICPQQSCLWTCVNWEKCGAQDYGVSDHVDFFRPPYPDSVTWCEACHKNVTDINVSDAVRAEDCDMLNIFSTLEY